MRPATDRAATIDPVFQPVWTALSRLVQQLHGRQSPNGELAELRNLLETLPLTTDEYGLACNRVQSVDRFLTAEEYGAAQWELNALTQRLLRQFSAPARELKQRMGR